MQFIGLPKDVLNLKHKGSMSYTDRIQQQTPTYLHELYHYMIKIAGNITIFDEIAYAMNEKSRAIDEVCEWLDLKWYNSNQ